jgi:hypothetical protein
MAGGAAAVIWFVVGGLLYMNPPVAKIFKKAEGSPALRVWKKQPVYLLVTFLGVLAQGLLWAFVFYFIRPVLPGTFWLDTLLFGIGLFVVKIIPRFIDMAIQTTYPKPLLAMEFVNGTISCFVMAAVFAWLL